MPVTLVPSSTHTSTFTVTSTLNPTQSATPTPFSTLPPLLTKTAPITNLDLPAWLKNARINVLMYRLRDDNKNPASSVSFLNPETSERFEMAIPVDSPSTFFWWQDGGNAVFQDEKDSLEVLDLSSATLAHITSQNPLFKTFDRVIPTGQSRYSTDFERNSSGQIINMIIVDTETGQKSVFSIGDFSYAWPVIAASGKYVAIVQSKIAYMEDANQITLYNYKDQTSIMTIEDEEINNSWFFPGDEQLIYTRGQNIPCIVNIATQKRNCIHTIHDKYPDATIYLRGLTADRQKLLFLHIDMKNGVHNGGLCFYDLASGGMNCPMDGLKIMRDQAVTDFVISPDEKYIAFIYEDSCPICDWTGLHTGLAVIGTDGTQFIDLGLPMESHPLINLAVHWRPLP
jgi:hypothetical protein